MEKYEKVDIDKAIKVYSTLAEDYAKNGQEDRGHMMQLCSCVAQVQAAVADMHETLIELLDETKKNS